MVINNKNQIRYLFFLFAFLATPLTATGNPDLEDFLREADIRDIELSPDGTHLAFITNHEGVRTAIVRDISKPGMPVVGSMAGDIVRPNFLYWANNDRLLIAMSIPFDIDKVIRDKQEKEDFDIYDYYMASRMISTPKDLSSNVILMDDERNLRRNFSLSRVTNFLPNDDEHVLMAAYRGGNRNQYKVNVYTGAAEHITKGSPRTYRFFNDEDGRPKFRFDYRHGSRQIIIFEFNEKGKWERVERIYLNEDDEGSIDSAGLLAVFEDNLVYRRQNEETGYYELTVVDRDTDEKSTLVSLPDQDVRGVLSDYRTDELVGYTVEQDYVRHHYFDESRQAQYDAILKQLGDYNFSISSYSEDSGTALIRSWGPDRPRSYQLWDVESQQLTLLARAYEGLSPEKLSVPVLSEYKTRDGASIRSYILYPRNYVEGEPHPTVLLPHGGPRSRSRATYSEFAQFLSTRGYVVVEPNFRGSVGYGREFEEVGFKEWGGLMQDDLTDAVEHLVREGVTDPDRVCIVGGSYGGYAALMGAVKTPSLFNCAISINGVTHLRDLLKYDMRKVVEKDDWQELLFDPIGHPDEDKALLDANSPVLHAKNIQIPILLIAGREDDVVPFAQSRDMEKALKRAKVEHEFIILPFAGHNVFRSTRDTRQVFEATEKFLAKHLQPGSD